MPDFGISETLGLIGAATGVLGAGASIYSMINKPKAPSAPGTPILGPNSSNYNLPMVQGMQNQSQQPPSVLSTLQQLQQNRTGYG